jgi:cytochrome c-type biogenesis protein CcmH/NrfG
MLMADSASEERASQERLLADLAQRIGDRTQELVVEQEHRFSIALQQTRDELVAKTTRLVKASAVGAAAGAYAMLGLLILLQALAFAVWAVLSGDTTDLWVGFIVVAVALFVLGALCGWLASRMFRVSDTPSGERPAAAADPDELGAQVETLQRRLDELRGRVH